MTRGRTDDVDPTPLTRIREALQPDWVHSVRTRKIVAAALVLLAGAAALRSDPGGRHSAVVVASRDLSPGDTLTVEDLQIENRLTTTLPDGAQTDITAMLSTTAAGPVRRGEVLTDVRILGSRLTEAAAGPGGRVVPLQLAHDAVVDVIRVGDVVDIVAAPQSGVATDPDAMPHIAATDAVVVLISADPGGIGSSGDRVVLVALPAAAATTVAAATLDHIITLTLH